MNEQAPRDPSSRGMTRRWERGETLWLGAVLVLVFVALQVHLGSVLVSDMDEGTYVYAGALMARGLVPYRDFMLTHPPLLSTLVAGWVRLFGVHLVALRAVYIAVILGSTVPLYALARDLSSRWAALLCVVSYTTGMLFLANMGRTVRLEPLMNAFVIAAFALRYLRPGSRLAAVGMGALLACAFFVKVVAVIPAGVLVLSELLWARPWQTTLRRWAFATAGALAVAVPAGAWCASQPRFFDDVLGGQIHRPSLAMGARMHYLAQNFARFPPVLLGLIVAAMLVARARDVRVRAIALVALVSSALLVFAFKTFFNYYIVQALPWIVCCFALGAERLAARWHTARWPAIAGAAVLVLGVAAPLAYAEAYERMTDYHVAGPRHVIADLRGDDGRLYSMYPAFALWSGRTLYPWYYQADSLVARINGWVGDDDFVDVFRGSSTLVLFDRELDDYPRAARFVTERFRLRYHDANWAVWQKVEPGP